MYQTQNMANLPIAYSATNIVAGTKPKGYMSAGEEMCKCGKYIADEKLKICFACERLHTKPFFNEK